MRKNSKTEQIATKKNTTKTSPASELISKQNEEVKAVDDFYQKKHHELDLKYDLENRESNFNRARSINVGTAFGGTTEVLMRGDGGKHLWCIMQPVEVVELIHQLSANIGCNVNLKPRQDFATWREWRVSELEKDHLNGHPPFVNDMAPFNNLGIQNFNEKEVAKLMDLISNAKSFIEEDPNVEIVGRKSIREGAPGVMVGKKDGVKYNKTVKNEKGEVIYTAGGDGGSG